MSEHETRGRLLHLGCGSVLGLLLGLTAPLGLEDTSIDGVVYVWSAIIGAVVMGLAAARYGDRFWNWMFGP